MRFPARALAFALPLLSPAFLLAACDQPPQDPEPVEPPPVPTSMAQAAMGPGLYEVGDGTTVYARTRLEEDGTYSDLDDAGAKVGGGSWRNEGDTICFDPEGIGEDLEERCWRNDPPEDDGSFMSRRTDGEQAYRVSPVTE